MKAHQIPRSRIVRWVSLVLGTAGLSVLCVGESFADVNLEKVITKLSVSPHVINLGGKLRFQQLVVTGHSESGRAFDVTRECELLLDGDCADVRGGVVHGVADGVGRLVIAYADQQVEVPIKVSSFQRYPAVDFVHDVVPLLTKHHCNAGGCHGKQGGQNGFQLSVFGFDPLADHVALTTQSRGRRVSRTAPAQSLFLKKATGVQAHGGGQRIAEGSSDEELLREWIQQGTPFANPHAPSLSRIEVFPQERILGQSAHQQLLVTAYYSDGTQKDVTSDAVYTSNAEYIASVDEQGFVQTGRTPGEAGITIAYMGCVGVSQIFIPRQSLQPFPRVETNTRVDELVLAKLMKMGIAPSELCNDATFLRRLFIDTLGTLPTASEVREFLADEGEDKRERAIRAALERPEYADFWAQRWADVLLVDRQKLGERGAYEFHAWLRTQMQRNRPYDQWVSELLTASGNSARYGPVNFFRALRTPEERVRAVSQAFLGVRLDCAQCHHHPFDKWSQKDFYGFAGFFSGVELKPIHTDRELLFHRRHQPASLPLTGEPISTRPLDGSPWVVNGGEDPRAALATWLTAKDNPWFARIAVNRAWKHFLGRGLVEPEDDLRMTNPPTNVELIQFLERQFIASGYDLKQLAKLILQSQTYQRSSKPNDTNADDTQNFSHYYPKRLRASVLLDAICQCTGVAEQYPGLPPKTRAIELWDNRLPSYFLDTFGRSQRASPCECGTSENPTMAQTLHLMNAPEINEKIASKQGTVAQLLAQGVDRQEYVETLCLTVLGRPATHREQEIAKRLFAHAPPHEAGEDFLWTLLNSYDFLFVH